MKLTHAIGATVVVAVAAYAQQFGSTHTPDALQSLSLNVRPDKGGQFTVRSNAAAHDWHPGTDVPSRKDGPDREPVEIDPATGKPKLMWPILAYYKGAWYPSIVWYYDNGDGFGPRFRSSTGGRWGAPERWAYVRWGKEVWNDTMGRMEVPEAGYTAPPPTAPPTGKTGVHMDATQGQWMVDDLKRSFTTTQIQDMMDASPYDEPDTGAPEAL